MKRSILFFLISTIFWGCFGQWQQMEGIYDNHDTYMLVQNDSTIVAWSYSGLFAKNSVLAPWELKDTYSFFPQSYAQKGDSIWLGTYYDGIKLLDLKNLAAPLININTSNAYSLVHSGTALYAALGTYGVGKWNTSTQSWTYMNQNLSLDTLIAYPNIPYYVPYTTYISQGINYLYLSKRRGIYRMAESLGVWENISTGLPISPNTPVSLIKETTNYLWAVIGSNLYYSANQGDTWSFASSAPSAIHCIFDDNATLFIGTKADGVLFSTDDGHTWTSMNTGLSDFDVKTITQIGGKMMCVTRQHGIFFLQNNQWQAYRKGMIYGAINNIANIGNELFISTFENIYKSTNTQSWELIPNMLSRNYFGGLKAIGDSLLLSVAQSRNLYPFDSNYVVFSPDKGNTWQSLQNLPPFMGDDAYRIMVNKQRLYVRENEFMSHTDNLGSTWQQTYFPWGTCNSINASIMLNETVFASTCGTSGLMRLEADNQWVNVSNGLPSATTDNLFTDGIALYVHIPYSNVYKSYDMGNTWSNTNASLPNDIMIRDFASINGHILLATNQGLYVKKTGNNLWLSANFDLKTHNLSSVHIHNGYIYVGTYENGVWKHDINTLLQSLANSPTLPALTFTLFPNPANETVTLYSEEDDTVLNKISVFDLTGRLYFEQNIENKLLIINIQNVPEGIYIARIITNKGTATQRFVVQH